MKILKPLEQTSTISVNDLVDMNREEAVKILASLFFSPREIAQFLSLDPDELHNIIIYKKKDPISIAYYHGQMVSKVNARLQEYEYAKSGSSSGADAMQRYYNQQKEEENA